MWKNSERRFPNERQGVIAENRAGWRRLLLLLLLLHAFALAAQEPDTAETAESDAEEDADDYIILQTPDEGLDFIGVAEEPAHTPNVVTREDMDREDALDLWQAVRNVPGVILSGGGARNDAGISVRGFDSASMPVFVDGVTLANPYRGDNDAARMLTGDVESITIEKGYSTMLLGPNTMGGAILVRTARPKKPLEARFSSGFGFDVLGKFADNHEIADIGVRRESFYSKFTFQYRGIDHFRIPYTFEPAAKNPQQKGDRLWSASNDIKLTLLAGWTPFYNMDLSLTWIYQDSNKGFSPPSVNGMDYEIWEWPYYKRQTFSFNGEWTPDAFTVKAAAYFQKFDNRLIDYGSWANYEIDMHNPYSDYDDYTAGFHLEAGWQINSRNRLETALNFRQDEHKGLTGEELTVRVNEDIWSLAFAYTANPLPLIRLSAGLGFDIFLPNEFWGERNESLKQDGFEYVEKTPVWKLWAAEAGAYYDISQNHGLRLTYARKNHFPTMFQRYSTRLGESTPNPNLGPEWADHFELGYDGRPLAALKLSAAAYYSLVSYKIVEIRVPKPDYTAVTIPYSVNLDSTAMWGLETSLEWTPFPALSAGAAFSWNGYSILKTSTGVTTLPLYPAVTASAYAVITPIAVLSLIPALQYAGSRFTGSNGGTVIDGYLLVNLKATYEINRHISADASIENIFDVLYEIRPYFPQAGRTYNLTVTAKY
jgi:iron complex outermembrane receptor protein